MLPPIYFNFYHKGDLIMQIPVTVNQMKDTMQSLIDQGYGNYDICIDLKSEGIVCNIVTRSDSDNDRKSFCASHENETIYLNGMVLDTIGKCDVEL